MTVLNFPPTNSQPSDGSFTYTANGVVYTWDGEKWTANTAGSGGMGTVHFTGDSPPPAGEATETDQWFNTNDGRLYTYTKNANGVLVWVDASPDSDTSLWERTGTTLAPTNAGDDVTTTGDLSAAAGTFSGRITSTVSSGNNLVLNKDTGAGIELKTTNDGQAGFVLSSLNDGLQGFAVRSDGTYVETLDVLPTGSASGPAGSLLIGGTLPDSPNITLNADGSAYFYNGAFVVYPDSVFIGSSHMKVGGDKAARWNSTTGHLGYDASSARYKDNIQDSDVGLAEVMQLRSVKFEYKDGGNSDIGFIAEEVAPIIPTLVGLDGEGEPETVSYDRMVSVLTKALQEAVTRIEALEAEVQQLEGGTN